MDIKSRSHEPAVLGTSNPGFMSMRAGGVGRNVAENLARLGVRTGFVTAFGSDVNGAWLRSETEGAGVSLAYSLVLPVATGSYTAILDQNGELLVAVSAMQVLEALTPEVLDGIATLISSAALLVLDCNLNAETLVRACAIARDAGVAILIDPVSVPKAGRVNAVLDAGIAVHTITPNVAELDALVASGSHGYPARAAARLHERGVEHVWIRRGEHGSVMSSRRGQGAVVEEFSACDATVVDVTGAGDATLAGYAAALLMGLSEQRAAMHGHAAAAMTVESEWTVNPLMTLDSVRARADACEAARSARNLVGNVRNG